MWMCHSVNFIGRFSSILFLYKKISSKKWHLFVNGKSILFGGKFIPHEQKTIKGFFILILLTLHDFTDQCPSETKNQRILVCLCPKIFWHKANSFLKNRLYFVFATVPDSSINSWESWFIFNLRKINTNQYYESVSLNIRNCKHITGTHNITWEWVYDTVITVHTWTAICLKHLANTSFMASFQAWTESHSGLSLWACIMANPVSCCLLQWVGFHS